MFALAGGARRGELLKLRYRDIDLSQRSITFYDTRSGEDRAVPFVDLVIQELKRLPRPIDAAALVFPSRRYPSQPMEFRKHWDVALAEAGIAGLTFHGLEAAGAVQRLQQMVIHIERTFEWMDKRAGKEAA
ncbi:MAG: site-specific integrase [Chromatiales bacterium]|nr:site-specific integrase [Chromatiales bacterium]